MKALSVNSYYATRILEGQKTIECRSWKTNHRGELLICANAEKNDFCMVGRACCIVNVLDVVPFTKKHLKAACMDTMPEGSDQYYAWMLDFVSWVLPVKINGSLNLFNVDDAIVKRDFDFLDDDVVKAAFDIPKDISEENTAAEEPIDNYLINFYRSIVTPAYYKFNRFYGDDLGFNADFAHKFIDVTGVEPSLIWSELPKGF